MRDSVIAMFTEPLLAVDNSAAHDYKSCAPAMLEYVNKSLDNNPALPELLGSCSMQLMHLNHSNHVQFMASMFQVHSATTLIDTIIWAYSSYIARGFSPDYFPVELAAWRKAVVNHIHADNSGAISVIYKLLIENHHNFLSLINEPLSEVQSETAETTHRSFLEAILKPDSADALKSARDIINNVDDIAFCWLHVIKPALYEVGRLWAEGKITVLQEHLATSIAQRVMSAFYPQILDVPRYRGNVVLCATTGELHEVGPRMIADCLEISGWNVLYTGADTPIDSLIDLLQSEHARFLCVSTALTINLASTRDLIAAVKTAFPDGMKIVVGGQAYDHDKSLWKTLGADHFAESAADAAQFLESCAN